MAPSFNPIPYLRAVITRYFIALFMYWLLAVDTYAQFAEKSYYLVDSLKLDELTLGDRKLLDSALILYHKAEHDTDRLNALDVLCENMMHKSWYKYQFIQYEMIKRLIDAGQPTTLKTKYLSYLADALNNIGYIYMNQGDIPKALEYYHKSLKIKEEIGDKDGIAISLNNIGVIYKNQGDIPKALEYFHKSLKIKEEIGDKKGIAMSLNNIGAIYRNQGDIPKALEYYHESLKIQEEIGDKKGMASSLNNIGVIYKNQGDIPLALQYYHKSLKVREELGWKAGIAISLNNIGGVELEQGELTSALNYGMRGLEIAREIGSPRHTSLHSSLLSKVARKQGNYKEALNMYELHIQMRDSIKNEETQKAAIRQQTKYEFEKAQLVKEQEKEELARLVAEKTARRDNLQYSVVLICLLVIGGVVVMLGRLSLPERVAEGIIFFSFLILFEFLLVLADPYIDNWSGGAPGIKLLFNAGIAALIFPMHSLFERKLKKRLAKS